MQLRLSAVRLKAIVVLVVSKQKGITLVFKNDPLESVDVSSTFDSVAVIQKYLQQEIEGQLREMFREDLPGIIHRLSQRWLSGSRESSKSGPSKSTGGSAPGPTAFSSPKNFSGGPSLGSSPEKRGPKPQKTATESNPATASLSQSPSARRRKSEKAATATSPPSSPRTTHRGSTVITSSPRAGQAKLKGTAPGPVSSEGHGERSAGQTSSSFDRSWSDMELYDPTYGLRPDAVRMSIHGSGYSGLAKLAGQASGGLRDLAILSNSAPSNENGRVEGVPQTSVPEEAVISDDEGEQDADSEVMDEDAIVGDLELSDSDDVPDCPPSDEEENIDEEGDDNDGAAADFTMYGYPPPSAAFSDTAVEDSARRSASLFSFQSPTGGSPRAAQGAGRSQAFSGVASKPASIAPLESRNKRGGKVEYETIPAVGGGIITRPRIYHTASRVQAPDVDDEDGEGDDHLAGDSGAASSTARGPSSSQTYTIRPSKSYGDDLDDSSNASDEQEADENEDETGTDDSPSALGHDSLATLEPEPMDPNSAVYRTQLYRQQYGRIYRTGYNRQSSMSSTISSSEASKRGVQGASQPRSPDRLARSTSRSSTAPTSTYPSQEPRRTGAEAVKMAVAPTYSHHSSPVQASAQGGKAPLSSQSMTMTASHHFMDLVNSNHTLSPFTRTLDTKGYAVRSHPVTPSTGTGSGGETSSSVGGYSSRPALTATRSSSSNQWRESSGSAGSYFERHKTVSEGAGRRRTFKLGSRSGDAAKRPDSTPVQQPRSSDTSTVKTAKKSLVKSVSQESEAASGRRRSRQFAQSERAVPRMGAIRE